MTPFEALYGIPPPPIIPYSPGSTANAEVDQKLRSREELLVVLKRNLGRAQERMKNFHDKRHTERSFAVGDMVFLKLQPYKQQSVHKRAFHKLSAKYYGPYEVLEKIGEVAYKLKLPPSAKIHNVFHVSLLKKKIGDQSTMVSQLPPISDSSSYKWSPAAILKRRIVKKNGVAATQWLVHWLGTAEEEATWEMADEIQLRFPEFTAET